MTKIVVFVILTISPFLLILGINEYSNNKPTNLLLKDMCSRYCHNHGCPHEIDKYKSKTWIQPYYLPLRKLYFSNINLLHVLGKGGLGYKIINLIVYVSILPLILTMLLWGAIRKKKVN